MKCREIKNYYDDLGNKKSKIVWFGSYGKNILAKKRNINLLDPFPISWYYYEEKYVCEDTPMGQICKVITETKFLTIKGQTYYLNFTNKNFPTTINILGINGNIIDSFTANSIGTYKLKGTLSEPIYSIELTQEDFEEANIILNEYSLSKKNTKTTNDKEITYSFVDEKEGVLSSLIERLSVLEGELWYKASYGQPITSITKSKIAMDSFIIKVINSHPDVESIDFFNSYIENKKYYCDIIIQTKYGNIEIKM